MKLCFKCRKLPTLLTLLAQSVFIINVDDEQLLNHNLYLWQLTSFKKIFFAPWSRSKILTSNWRARARETVWYSLQPLDRRQLFSLTGLTLFRSFAIEALWTRQLTSTPISGNAWRAAMAGMKLRCVTIVTTRLSTWSQLLTGLKNFTRLR